MAESFIKKLIKKYKKALLGIGSLGVTAAMTVGIVSCNSNKFNTFDDFTDNGYEQTASEDTNFGTTNNQGGNSQSTNNSINSGTTDANVDKFAHSDTYNRTKQKWESLWGGVAPSMRGELGFLTKAAPFKFLAEEGVVYYNSEGKPRAYGTDENFDNIYSIQSKAWVDPNTPENDLYLLTQYISAPVDDENHNGNTYVATYMLKYALKDDCYRDLLLLSGDFRSSLLIQQIDQEYTPELISKSLIRYDLIDSLNLFKDLPNGGVNQPKLDYYKEDVSNYVSNIDYTNMTITVNYNTNRDKGTIYSYTYKLKETKNWEDILQGDDYTYPVPKEERDALTTEQIMPTYSSNIGKVLSNARVFNWKLLPSAEQKATATAKYKFDYLYTDVTGKQKVIEQYESGQISYEEVNRLTRDYVNNLRSGLTK